MLTKPRLLTPGPTQLPDRVRLAMAADMIHHRKPEFKKIMAEVQEGLQELFGTTEPVLPLTSSGTGAMSAAVSALFQPGETVLVIEAGRFSERWTEIAKACDVQTRVLSFPWGSAASPEAIARELDAYPEIAGVLVQLSETSTGVQHPIKEIATITRNRPALLVVDGISGVSITPCPMDAWGVDCLVTGSQKGIMLPPGLAFIACSQRAWKKAERVPCKNFYFNLLAERENIQKNKPTLLLPSVLSWGLKKASLCSKNLACTLYIKSNGH